CVCDGRPARGGIGAAPRVARPVRRPRAAVDRGWISRAARGAGPRARGWLVSEALIGAQTLSLDDVAQSSLRIVDRLRAAGLGPGERAFFAPEPSIDAVLLVHALIELNASMVLAHPRW